MSAHRTAEIAAVVGFVCSIVALVVVLGMAAIEAFGSPF